MPGQLAHDIDERRPPRCRDIEQHRCVEHDQRRAGRCLCGKRRQVVNEVAAHEQRRVSGSDSRCSMEPSAAVRMFGPDEGSEPGDVGGIGHVERIEIQTGPPHHVGKARRRRHTGEGAFDDRFAGANRLVAVAIRVPVGIEAQPCGRTDLEQRERLRQRERGREPRRHNARLHSSAWSERAAPSGSRASSPRRSRGTPMNRRLGHRGGERRRTASLAAASAAGPTRAGRAVPRRERRQGKAARTSARRRAPHVPRNWRTSSRLSRSHPHRSGEEYGDAGAAGCPQHTGQRADDERLRCV